MNNTVVNFHTILKNSCKGGDVTVSSFFKCNKTFINTKSINY